MVLATSVVSSPKPSLFGCGVALGGGGGRSGGSCPAAGGFGACALTGRGPKLRTRAVNNTVLRSDIEVSPRHDAAPCSGGHSAGFQHARIGQSRRLYEVLPCRRPMLAIAGHFPI